MLSCRTQQSFHLLFLFKELASCIPSTCCSAMQKSTAARPPPPLSSIQSTRMTEGISFKGTFRQVYVPEVNSSLTGSVPLSSMKIQHSCGQFVKLCLSSAIFKHIFSCIDPIFSSERLRPYSWPAHSMLQDQHWRKSLLILWITCLCVHSICAKLVHLKFVYLTP